MVTQKCLLLCLTMHWIHWDSTLAYTHIICTLKVPEIAMGSQRYMFVQVNGHLVPHGIGLTIS